MDVLNPSPAVILPKTMWVLYRVVAQNPDISDSDLLNLVCPPTMREVTPGRGAHARRALAALKDFELIGVDNSGLRCYEECVTAKDFVRRLRRLIIAPPIETGTGGAAPELRQALVWLLRQAPTDPLVWPNKVEKMIPEGVLENGTRWSPFVEWSQHLGFSKSAPSILSGASAGSIVANPVDAIGDVLDHPSGDQLTRGQPVPMPTFLEFLRRQLPVLPGHPSASLLNDPSEEEVGPALSYALLSLEHRGALSMQRLSDTASAVALIAPFNPRETRYVSTVTVTARVK